MDANSNELELASISSRAVAFIIDDILITLLVFLVFWDLLGANSDNVEQMLLAMNSIVWKVLFIKFIYQAFFIWYYGATVGKLIAKIRVIDVNTYSRVGPSSAVLRSASRILSEMFFYIGFMIALFNDGKRSFHDIMGRSLVVKA